MVEERAMLADKPAHVPEELVRDFDFYNIPGSEDDVQGSYMAVQQANPDIFWTPRNGGHWVATRAEDITVLQKDYTRFSYRHIVLPPMPADMPPQIPLELDPPIHGEYRRPLVQALLPSQVRHLEANVRQVAVDAVEALLPRGECEFISEFSKVLPIHVFMSMVDLPIADKEFLITIAEVTVRSSDSAKRREAQEQMGGYLYKWIMERRDNPGDDLISSLVNSKINGERISVEDAVNYCTLVLFGGLDTVAGMLGFVAKFLAEHPEHRHQLVERLDDDKFVYGAIEELIRRHGIANTARVVTHDLNYKGVEMHKGDRILPPNLLVGMDDRVNPDPLKVDFNRAKPVHAAFGNGAHACPGAILARRELRIFLDEWLTRIPDFRIKPGTKPKLVTGQVSGILELQLVWP